MPRAKPPKSITRRKSAKGGSDNPQAVSLTRDAAVGFLSADVDGDQRLTFDEFCGINPDQKMTNAELRELFDSIDVDGSGDISQQEFFFWTLSTAHESTGCGIEAIFRKYDKSGEGQLDALEFARACEDMGYGSIAHELFLELDKDEGGAIAYGEVMELIQGRQFAGGHKCKQFLTSLAFERADGDGKGVELDTTEWELFAETEAELRSKLEQYLLDQSARVSDLYANLTAAHTMELTKSNFVSAFFRIGFSGHVSLLKQLFDDMDSDESSLIGVEEMYTWMNGRMKRAQLSRDINFDLRDPSDPPLRELDWGGDDPTGTLRVELQRLLIRAELCPLDLLRGWDSDGGGTFTKKEFLVMMKKIIHDQDLWDDELREVVKAAFASISGGDKSIDVTEFERWLNKGWLQLKASVMKKTAVVTKADATTQLASAHAASVIASLGDSLFGKTGGGGGLRLGVGKTCTGKLSAARANAEGWSDAEREYAAACIMQRHARKHAFKKQAALVLQVEMTEAKAATIVQAHWRSLQAKRRVRAKRDEMIEQKAIIKLQNATRVYLARKHRSRLIEKKRQDALRRAERASKESQDEKPAHLQVAPTAKTEQVPAAMEAQLAALRRQVTTLKQQLAKADGKARQQVGRLQAQHSKTFERIQQSHASQLREHEQTLFVNHTNHSYALAVRDKEVAAVRTALDEALRRNRSLEAELMEVLRAQYGPQLTAAAPEGSPSRPSSPSSRPSTSPSPTRSPARSPSPTSTATTSMVAPCRPPPNMLGSSAPPSSRGHQQYAPAPVRRPTVSGRPASFYEVTWKQPAAPGRPTATGLLASPASRSASSLLPAAATGSPGRTRPASAASGKTKASKYRLWDDRFHLPWGRT